MDNFKVAIIIGLCLLIVALCVMIKKSKVEESFDQGMCGCTETMANIQEPEELPPVPTCINQMPASSAIPAPADPFDFQSKSFGSENPVQGNTEPNHCFPKGHLDPQELLPSSEVTEWSHANPVGQGALEDQSFLHAGFHVGINTVGQSLRNANMQLRSEPANPVVKVGPWMQSTIEPDLSRKALEIAGEDCS